MSWLSRLRHTFGSGKLDDQLEEELRSHLEMRIADNINAGMTPTEARHEAQKQFGNTSLLKEDAREIDIIGWLDTVAADLHYATRVLRKNPGFALTAVLTLALGIGANTAFFSVVNGVLLNPFPYPRPEQLVTLGESKANFINGSISYPNFFDWQKDNHSFSSMAIARTYGFSLTGLGDAEQLDAKFISSDYFLVLGANPVIGGTLAPGEDKIGAAPIALIGAGFWKRKFGSSPDVLGKGVTLDGKSYTIVGVIPEAFDLYRSAHPTDVYVPIGQWSNPLLANRDAGLGIHGVARLKSGVTIEQARADMEHVTSNLATVYPDVDKGIGANLTPFRRALLGDIEPVLLVLLGAVGFVLLIACFNVASLMLARSTSRTREFAVRVALGAGRSRLIRQILTESTLLSVMGGSLGLLLAHWITRAALRMLPAEMPRAADIRMDSHVLIFTAAISLLAGILFGLAPALKSSDFFVSEALKESGRGSSGTKHSAQSAFVILEMAMALVLLIGAGLMARTLTRLWDIQPGFDPHNVLTFSISLPPSMSKSSPAAIRAAFRNIHKQFGSTRGVQALSVSWGAVPLGADDEQLFWLDNQPKPANVNDMNWTISYVVEPDYLKTMGIPVMRGRFFTVADSENAQHVVVIDEVLAHKFFGNEDPLGRHITLQQGESKAEIVGVVPHVKQWGLDSDDTQQLRAELYVPFMQLPDAAMKLAPTGTTIMVRSDGSDPQLFDSLRRVNKQMSGEQVIYGAQTMEEIISASLSARRFPMILLGVFAALALILSSIGIYGVISHLVGQRTHEIGVRIALGARRWDVLHLILSQGAKLTLLGIVIGVAASLGLTKLMSRMLYGVSASDPLTFIGVAILLSLVALAACYIPTRRAMRVDPMVALRCE
ncbi:MAG TPA: ABC transporter permease [Candidatus Acidoferrum sp.]|jgi:predicted permease|nr:ABC transporter permease [Candidatus Acidoferrum sp.]